MELERLHKEFIEKLEILFGKFNPDNNKFSDASNSEISREIGYSDAQFSRLTHASASEGEFKRALKNIDRILLINKLEKKVNNGKKPSFLLHSSKLYALIIFFFLSSLAMAIVLFFDLNSFSEISLKTNEKPKDYTLRWAFESSFINPYVGLNDLPETCDYPCYKYQGKWKLDDTYKLPFFRERNGFHYLATDVNMYARCMTEKSSSGQIIEGYEYQKHEIWYDMREWPIDSFLNDRNNLSERYKNLDFTQNENFVKLADIHTFFRNEFYLDSLHIRRSGKVIGRDLEIVSDEELRKSIPRETTLEELRTEINMIVANRLEDFSIPINCQDSPLINPDFNKIKEGDIMSFDCQLTTSRFSINYRKSFVLNEQYIKNTCVTYPN